MYTHDINPFAFTFFGINVSWYWLFYPLGFFIVYISCHLYLSKTDPNYKEKDLIDFTVILWITSLLGGRLGYFLFYQTELLFTSPSSLLEIWRGGMSFHGGLLLCLFVAWYLHKKKLYPVVNLGSTVLLFLPIGLFLGRIGNFINGELWGHPSDLPWAVVFPKADLLSRHPSQLYEAIAEGPILFSILWLTKQKFPIWLMFLVGYSMLRFFVEFTREADRHIGYFAGLSLGQYLCIVVIGIGILLLKKRTFH